MSIQDIRSRSLLALLVATFAAAHPALGQEVTLKGIDSPLNITGTLLSATGGKFVVRTAIGEFEIDQAIVTCEGEGCPEVREITYDLNFGGNGDVGEVLVPILVEGFAATLDAETVLLDQNGNPLDAEAAVNELGEAGKIDIELVDYDGEELANFGVVEAEGMEAYELLASGEAPIIFTDLRANRKERDFIKDAGAGDLKAYEQDHVIAVEGFAVIVNPQNEIGAISVQQVADIFAGKITDWQQLGGPAGPINLYSYDSDSETFDSISELVLERFDYALSPEANIVRNASEMSEAVTRDAQGFGIINYHSRRGTRALPLTNECGMTFYVSPFSIKTEEYPFSHRVHAYSRPGLEGYAHDFMTYLEGPDLDGLVSKAGFVDLSVVAEVQVDAAERVAAAAAQESDSYVKGFMDTIVQKQNQYERLSTTFRFAPGSNELDGKSRRDLGRMMVYLSKRKPQEVIAVGFTDNKGTFDANVLVGEQRAQEVIDQIRSNAGEQDLEGVSFTALGFGELSPSACNSDPRGRATNRRVEIWVK